jgi:UPF0716 protein FxsA
MRRFVAILAVLVIFSIIEIAVLIAVGQAIGLGWALLLLLSTSALGAWLLRREGGKAWRTFRGDLTEGRPPGQAATEGLLVFVGGVFMLVPGFVSDVIGALLILPPTRRVARALVVRSAGNRFSPQASTALFGPRRVRAYTDAPRPEPPSRAPADGPAIEGEIIDPR